MFCKNCGIQLKDGVSFCPACGTQVSQSSNNNDLQYARAIPVQPAVDPRASSYAGKALTFGILGFIFCWIPIIGLIFCIAAKSNTKRKK